MSQVASTILDLAEIVGGIIAAPFTGGSSLAISALGASNLMKDTAAAQQASAEKNQISPNPVPQAGQPYNLPGSAAGGGGASGNAPGATTGTAVIPDEQAVINERADAANLSLAAYEQQGLSSISNLKVQEQRQESAIVAGAAGRGLRLEGSPLYQLNAQKEAGATVIAGAETQLNLGERGIKQQGLASYNAGLLNMSDKSLSIQTDLSNQWLSSFTNLINVGSSYLGKFWNPAQSMSAMDTSPQVNLSSGTPYYG